MLAFAMLATICYQANQSTPQKNTAANSTEAEPDLVGLVDPGNPSHRHAPCATAHPARLHHCLVALAAGASGRRKAFTSETENATVVLEQSFSM